VTAEPFEAARALLPAWVRGGLLAYVPLGFAFGVAAAYGVSRASYPPRVARRLENAHWTERARFAFAGRMAMLMGIVIAATSAFVLTDIIFGETITPLPILPLGGAIAIAILLGGSVPRWALERRLGRNVTYLERLRGGLSLALLMWPHLLTAGVLAIAIGQQRGAFLYALTAVGCVCAWFAGSGGGFTFARALGLVRPAGGRVAAAVEEAARRAGTTVPPAYELEWTLANAFALPSRRCVVFTRGAVSLLDDEQLRAVAAHEIEHLGEPRRVRRLRSVAAFSLPLGILLVPAVTSSLGAIAAIPLLVASLSVQVALRGTLSRTEERADAAAVAQDRSDLLIYGCALERIYEANLAPAVLRARGVHPHLYDRLLAAGVQPAYPRPPRPPYPWAFLLPPVAFLCFIFAMLVVGIELRGNERAILVGTAFGGGDSYELGELAYARSQAGDARAAATLYRAQIAMMDRDTQRARQSNANLNLATVLADDGQCREAAEALAEAERRIQSPNAVMRDRLHGIRNAVERCGRTQANGKRLD
jgi:Zn-dependent protease with chaperone function